MLKFFLFIRWRFSGIYGQCTVTKSDVFSLRINYFHVVADVGYRFITGSQT